MQVFRHMVSVCWRIKWVLDFEVVVFVSVFRRMKLPLLSCKCSCVFCFQNDGMEVLELSMKLCLCSEVGYGGD